MITSDEQKVVNCFQDYFHSIVVKKNEGNGNEINALPNAQFADKFSFQYVDEHKIILLLRNLDAGKSASTDDEAAKPIIYPKVLKRTFDIPIYKSGDE